VYYKSDKIMSKPHGQVAQPVKPQLMSSQPMSAQPMGLISAKPNTLISAQPSNLGAPDVIDASAQLEEAKKIEEAA